MNLFSAFAKALEANLVPIIPIPYSDQEMKKMLVEKGVLSELQVNAMIENGRESWRGPIEGKENEKYRREMEEIEEKRAGWSDSLRRV